MCLATEFTYSLTTEYVKIIETNVTVQFWIMFLNCGTKFTGFDLLDGPHNILWRPAGRSLPNPGLNDITLCVHTSLTSELHDITYHIGSHTGASISSRTWLGAPHSLYLPLPLVIPLPLPLSFHL